MNCTHCKKELTPLEEIEILEAEAELTMHLGRVFKAPDAMKRCGECFELHTGEAEVQ